MALMKVAEVLVGDVKKSWAAISWGVASITRKELAMVRAVVVGIRSSGRRGNIMMVIWGSEVSLLCTGFDLVVLYDENT